MDQPAQPAAAPARGTAAAEQVAWEEIELLSEAMIAGVGSDHRLSGSEVDAVLGVDDPARREG